MRFGSASMTVTGTVSPASLKTRVIPALRPTRPRVLAALIVCPLVPRFPLIRGAASCDWLAAAKNPGRPKARGRFDYGSEERPTGDRTRSRRSSGTPSGPDLGAKEARIIEIQACIASLYLNR